MELERTKKAFDMILSTGYWFEGIDGKDVYAEVWQHCLESFSGNQFEPRDISVLFTELWINGNRADSIKHRKVVDYVLERGR